MKLLIFGASGSIGIQIVRQALDAGHDVSAFVRSPENFALSHSRLELIEGNVLGPQKEMESAIAGKDAVLIALGAGLKGGVRAEGTRNIIAAMQNAGVKRLICQTTLAAGESFGNLNLKWRLIFRLPLRWALKDHELQESHVKNSDLDWTIIRPASFTDGPLTGNYKSGFPSTEKDIALEVSRSDVAHFMLQQLKSNEDHHELLSLSY